MSDIDQELLKRYAKGTCKPEERLLVEQWLNQGPMELVNDDIFSEKEKYQLKQKIWAAVRPEPAYEKTKFLMPAAAYKLASCFLLLLLAGYFCYKSNDYFKRQRIALAPEVYKECAVPNGRKVILTLTDGTVVHLNSGSTLKYPEGFSGKLRVVYLSGEAHFKVAKNPSKPFIIHTAKTDTRVLGTVFDVKAYPEEANTTLTVEKGRVQFSLKADPARRLILTAGLQGTASEGQTLQMQHVYAHTYTAWKEERLIFNNLSLAEIAPVLSRWYNVAVTVDYHKLKRDRFTGTYTGEPLAAIGQDISQALHCRFKLTNNKLIFY